MLILLVVSVLLAALGSLAYAGLDRLRTVDDEIEMLKRQYVRLQGVGAPEPMDIAQKMRELEQAEGSELDRYYRAEEMDLYRFGSAVNALLVRHGMTVDQFRTVSGSRVSTLELTVRGSPISFMAFLADVSSAPKYWALPYLHIQSRSGNGTLTCEFQIGYMVHETAKQVP